MVRRPDRLTECFGPSIEYDPNAITDVPEGFKRLAYQIDAVNSGYRLLEKHNGLTYNRYRAIQFLKPDKK